MGKAFKRVIRYRCQWCGKEFKTDHLHDCKFDPDKRNCLSCIHQIGSFCRDEPGDGYEERGHYFQCEVLGKNTIEDTNKIEVLCLDFWRGGCPFYESVPDWKGKETFRKRRQAQEGEKP